MIQSLNKSKKINNKIMKNNLLTMKMLMKMIKIKIKKI